MTSEIGPIYFLDSDGFARARGYLAVKKPTPTARASVRLTRLRAVAGLATPPVVTHSPGWLPEIGATELNAMLTAGTAVRFSTLQTGADSDTVTTESGRTLHSYGAGVMNAIFQRCPANKAIIFDQASIYEANEPNWTNGDAAAIQVPKSCAGLYGWVPPGTSWSNVNPQRTTLRVKTMTAPAKNVAGAWFKIGYSGSVRFDVANLHWEGTEQGFQSPADTGVNAGPGNDGTSRRIFTNFFAFGQADGNTARDCLSTGNFGNNGAPPGESFAWEWYGSTGGINCRVNVDGRRDATSLCYSSAGHSFGNSLRCILTDSFLHHCGEASLVFFQSVNCKTYNCILGDENDKTTGHISKWVKGDWLNHERTTGSEHYNIRLMNWVKQRAQVEHVSHSNDNWTMTRSGETHNVSNGTLLIVDPVFSPVLFGGKGTVATWIPYWTGNTMTQTNKPIIRKSTGAAIPAKWNYGGTWLDI